MCPRNTNTYNAFVYIFLLFFLILFIKIFIHTGKHVTNKKDSEPDIKKKIIIKKNIQPAHYIVYNVFIHVDSLNRCPRKSAHTDLVTEAGAGVSKPQYGAHLAPSLWSILPDVIYERAPNLL